MNSRHESFTQQDQQALANLQSKLLIDEIKNRLPNITTEQLDRLEFMIHIELMERSKDINTESKL